MRSSTHWEYALLLIVTHVVAAICLVLMATAAAAQDPLLAYVQAAECLA